MIVVTGAAGFIGSNIVRLLNQQGYSNIILSDRLDHTNKYKNLMDLNFIDYVDKDDLFDVIDKNPVTLFISMGARTDTMENDSFIMMKDNYEYMKKVWDWCVNTETPLIYASSAAVYGNGNLNFLEDINLAKLIALNPYACSKLLFDRWAEKQTKQPPGWVGLRFFNVYGPGESHKGRMASMVHHGYLQARDFNEIKLFKSYISEIQHGEQKRDFIHVKDVAEVVCFLMEKIRSLSGFLNIGTGISRSFNELVSLIFEVTEKPRKIKYIDMPKELKNQYQYYTVASIEKLKKLGYVKSFTDLEIGVREYIAHLQRHDGY